VRLFLDRAHSSDIRTAHAWGMARDNADREACQRALAAKRV
jgi:hypothetical protein